MKEKTTPTTTIATVVIALTAVFPAGALAQQKAVEQFNEHLEQRDVSASNSATTENRHAGLQSLEHRIERLEQDHNQDDARAPTKARHTETNAPC